MSLRRRLAVLAVSVGALAAPPAAAEVPTTTDPATAAAISGLARDFTRVEAPIGRYQRDVAGDLLPPFSSPAVGDITGDGVLDLVHGAPNGFLYVFRATDGALQRTLFVGDGMIVSSPTLTDVNNDGRLDVVVGLMPTREAPGVPTVLGFDGATGATLLSRSTCAFGAANCDVFTTVVAADLDGDNDEELILTSQNGRLQAWRGNGADFFAPLNLLDTTRSSPAVGDLDGAGRPEIVLVSDLDTETCRFGGPVLQGPPGRGCFAGERGSMIWIVNADGSVRNRRFLQREIAYSSPAIGDLDGDGRPEIVVGSGLFYAVNGGGTGGDEANVTALDADLNILPGWPVRLAARTMASPALVDIDGGGREVATMDSSGRLYLIGADGHIRWTQCARDVNPGCGPVAVGTDGSPVAADVDGDGEQEIVTLGEHTLQVRDARTGAVEASDNLQLNPVQLTNQVATPVIYADPAGLTRIAAHVLWDPDANGRGAGDAEGIVQWRTGARLGRADWPALRASATTRNGTAPGPRTTGCANPPPPRFTDLGGLPPDRVGDVACLVALGITQGLTPSTFGPTGTVSRAQMASFTARILDRSAGPPLPASPPAAFTDDAAPHEARIDQLAAVGIIGGNGEDGARYFPSAPMRRDHAASFLARAYERATGAPLPPGPDAFGDDTANPHAADIDALAAAGVIRGTSATTFGPAGSLSRLQMASLLARYVRLSGVDGEQG